MTIKEAKEVLQEHIDKYAQEYDDEGIEALKIAIKILEQDATSKKGHWINKRCSACGCQSMLGLCVENYCANCGAKMKEVEE